jgi:hypothetical protein
MPILIVIELTIGVILVVVWGYKDLTRELSQRPCQDPIEPDDDDGDDDARMHPSSSVKWDPLQNETSNASLPSFQGAIQPDMGIQFIRPCLHKEQLCAKQTTPGVVTHSIADDGAIVQFAESSFQHGGQETTLFSIITNLLHFGMVVVGLDYGHAGQMTLNEVTGGSPYGASTIVGRDGSRPPTENELIGAHYQGRKIADTAGKLFP